MPEEVLALLFNHVDPIYEHHTVLLKEIEHRLAAWFVLTIIFTSILQSNHLITYLGKAVRTVPTKWTFTKLEIYCSK